MTRIHLSIPFGEHEVGEVAAHRHRWDPAMASRVPPHVTVAYPEEHLGDIDLLVSRAAAAACEVAPFSLTLREVVIDDDDGAGGVFVRLDDPSRSWSALRERIVVRPFERLPVSAHLTIVHPRTSADGPAAWRALRGAALGQPVAVHRFVLSASDPDRGFRIEQTFALTGTRRRLCAAVIPVDVDGRVLLGRRRDDAAWYPGVWDLIGGGVETGEAVDAAACRELEEEVGLHATPDDLWHCATVVGDDHEVVVFGAQPAGAPSNRAPHEHAEVAWHPIDDIGDLALSDPALVEVCRRAAEHVSG